MASIDFTQPETLHKLAALPFYGYAEALVRRVDPYWHAPEPPYTYKVHLGQSERCCSCGHYDEKHKVVLIEASNEEEAETIAARENKGWFVASVDTPKFPTASVPERYLQQFERSQAA